MSPTLAGPSRSTASPVVRGILLALGAALLAFILCGPAIDSPQAQGRPFARAAAAAGVSILLFGLAYGSAWQRSAAILGGGITGQAFSLALIDCPNYAVLQHYFPWSSLIVSERIPLSALFVQTAFVLALAWRLFGPAAAWLGRLISFRGVLAVAAVVVAISANPSRSWERFAAELPLAAWIIAVQFATLALAAHAAPAEGLRRVASSIERRIGAPDWDRRLPLVCAASVFLASSALCWFVFGRVPHVPDEVSYLFQAKYFAAGQLYLPAPPDARSFEVGQVFTDGVKWYGYGFPGWPAVLALGVKAGIPWAMNPLLGALIVLLAHRLITMLSDRRTAHAVALLLAVSPWFLVMSASFMTHNCSLALALAGFIALENQRRRRGWLWSLLAGLSLGSLMLTRPLEGIVVGLVMAWSALGLTGRQLRFGALICFGGTAVLLGSLLLPYNRILTGSRVRTPQQVWTDSTFYPGSDRLGFGPDIGNWGWPHLDAFPGHGARDVLFNIQQNLFLSQSDLFGWGCGSMLFILAAFWLRSNLRSDRLFLALIAGVVIAQSFYWFSGGPDYGARYWYQMLIPFLVLTVRGVQDLQRRAVRICLDQTAAHRIVAFLVCASAVSLLTFVPWRSLGKYHNFRRVTSDMRELARSERFGKSIVFVGGDEADYPSAFVFNPAGLDEPDPIYVRDRGPSSRAAIRKHFPDRPAWFVARSGKDHRFHVTAGPWPAAGSAAKELMR